MKKNVIISISGTQTSLDGDSEHIELMTPGTLARKGGAYLLSYQETPLSGLDGTETTFTRSSSPCSAAAASIRR